MLTNTGTSAMAVRHVGLAGPNAGDFQSSDDCPATLPAAASCTASVTFTPTATGSRSASLTFDDDAPGSPQTLPLSGTGVGGGVATLSATSLSYDDRVVGTRSDARAVTLTNTGTAPLAISTFRFAGDDAGDFAQGSDCPVSPNPVAVGASCTIYVSFGPSSAGAEVGAGRDRRRRRDRLAGGRAERPRRHRLRGGDAVDGRPARSETSRRVPRATR